MPWYIKSRLYPSTAKFRTFAVIAFALGSLGVWECPFRVFRGLPSMFTGVLMNRRHHQLSEKPLALRATPSGTAGHHREGTPHTVNNQRISRAEERRLSVQYLANQKPPSYLQSVFPI